MKYVNKTRITIFQNIVYKYYIKIACCLLKNIPNNCMESFKFHTR